MRDRLSLWDGLIMSSSTQFHDQTTPNTQPGRWPLFFFILPNAGLTRQRHNDIYLEHWKIHDSSMISNLYMGKIGKWLFSQRSIKNWLFSLGFQV